MKLCALCMFVWSYLNIISSTIGIIILISLIYHEDNAAHKKSVDKHCLISADTAQF